jgi:hypothetical protein
LLGLVKYRIDRRLTVEASQLDHARDGRKAAFCKRSARRRRRRPVVNSTTLAAWLVTSPPARAAP